MQVDPTEGVTRVLVDGGLPIGPDADEEALRASWTVSEPDAVLVAADRPSRYDIRDVASLSAQHPRISWRSIGDAEHPGINHDRIIDSAWPPWSYPG